MAKEENGDVVEAPMDVDPAKDAKKDATEGKDAKKDEKDKKPAEDELSEEDAALKSELEMLVERLQVRIHRVIDDASVALH
jgi:hypothetical protein